MSLFEEFAKRIFDELNDLIVSNTENEIRFTFSDDTWYSKQWSEGAQNYIYRCHEHNRDQDRNICNHSIHYPPNVVSFISNGKIITIDEILIWVRKIINEKYGQTVVDSKFTELNDENWEILNYLQEEANKYF
ncbi:MAG: hypothetical protein Terrestrivirus1_254 [Terrestrivirus sp.]|uniref:Uncharacterized protein n=1 Tax=Terrestrivirus sp. TaxID=2487775 RepID=A0A3G4ZKM4_9VIRU|nr:MAG: hypothetical protein Terrestrivirus1_254 [Terrestrivirus sp.]